MSLRLHGIAHCDTVRKARAFLGEHGLAHEFVDYGKRGLEAAALDRWIAALGWEALLNRKGTTWRRLDEALRARITDAGSARAAMLEHPSLIRRPVVEWGDGEITVGFDAARWRERG